jgi:hypothetical protein
MGWVSKQKLQYKSALHERRSCLGGEKNLSIRSGFGQGLISKQYFDQLFDEGKLGTNSFQTLNWPYWVDQRSIEKLVDVD